MKLVEILARELKEWPEEAAAIVQDADNWVGSYAKTPYFEGRSWAGDYIEQPLNNGFETELATDHATAIVTRPQWEAEKARTAGGGTWLRHRGRKCPVQSGTLVDLKLRGGVIHRSKFCDNHAWIHTGKPFDVMYYRLSEPDEQLAPVSEEAIQVGIDDADAGKLTPIVEVKARFVGKADGPLFWRDRIYELDNQRAELEATYQRQIGEIDGEREGLVGKLRTEGLALVGVVLADEDMSDWRNWKAGDLITCMTAEYPDVYEQGKSYVVKEVRDLGALVFDDCGTGSCCSISDRCADKFKWHSRPAS